MDKKKNNKYKSNWSLKKPLYLNKADRRYKKHLKQLKKWGFSDSETWSLNLVIAEFILPRLKRFREIDIGMPGCLTESKWEEILDKMIFAFENIVKDEIYSKTIDIKIGSGLRLFGKYFRYLWW